MTNDSILDIKSEIDKLVTNFDIKPLLEDMSLVGSGQIQEVKNESGKGNLYYQWLACAMQYLKPRQVVELGAASGISTICMAKYLPEDSKLYSVDIDPTIAWKWMSKDYPQVIKILGDDLDMNIWKGVDLSKTDFWFIDSLHTKEQLSKEMELYPIYWKKGTIVAFDDVDLPGMKEVWTYLPFLDRKNDPKLHYTGFGILKV